MGTIEDGSNLGWTDPRTTLRVSAASATDPRLLGRGSQISASTRGVERVGVPVHFDRRSKEGERLLPPSDGAGHLIGWISAVLAMQCKPGCNPAPTPIPTDHFLIVFVRQRCPDGCVPYPLVAAGFNF